MRCVDKVVKQIGEATGRDRTLIAARLGIAMEPGASQPQALLDLAETFEEAQIPYALIGGIAVGIHSAQPRATVDVDVAVSTSIARTVVVDALAEAGFDLVGEHPHSLNFRHANGEPVRVSFDQPFDPMIEHGEIVSVGDVALRIVTLADLIETKERAASDPSRRRSKALRERADIELLHGDVAEQDEGW
jgi:hypothetical protein